MLKCGMMYAQAARAMAHYLPMSLLRGGLLCGAALIFASVACGSTQEAPGIDDDHFGNPSEETDDDTNGSPTGANGSGGAATTAGNGGSPDDDGNNGTGGDPDPTSGAGGDPAPSTGSGSNPDPQNNCCDASAAPGCADQAVQACVCAQDDYCCDSEWDEQCIAEVDEFGCGVCDSNPTPPPAPEPKADCCDENPGGVGCLDSAVEACVCAADDYCCNTEWDAQCVDEVDSLGCGSCGGNTQQQQPPPPAKGDCCTENLGAMGCIDAAVEACVCAADDYCCDTEWDQLCVDEVDSLACGSCGGNQQQQQQQNQQQQQQP